MTLNSVSTSTRAQERTNEAVNRRQRAGGLARGKDDKFLVLLVAVDFLVVLVVVILVIRRARWFCGNRGFCHHGLGDAPLGNDRLCALHRTGVYGDSKLVVERRRCRINRLSRLGICDG
jgi:hypothetical protein